MNIYGIAEVVEACWPKGCAGHPATANMTVSSKPTYVSNRHRIHPYEVHSIY